jgi:hypothetical protein
MEFHLDFFSRQEICFPISNNGKLLGILAHKTHLARAQSGQYKIGFAYGTSENAKKAQAKATSHR